MRLRLHCANRAGLVPLAGVRLQMAFVNRAVLVSLLGVRLQLHCVNRAVLVPRPLSWGTGAAPNVPVLGEVSRPPEEPRARLPGPGGDGVRAPHGSPARGQSHAHAQY